MAKKSKVEIIKINRDRHMVITPIVRLSFPQLFTPKSFENDPSKPKEFRCDLLAESKKVWKEEYKGKKTKTISLTQAIMNCKIDQWGEDKSKRPHFRYPTIKNGDERTTNEGVVYEGYEGISFITPKTDEKYPPRIVLANGQNAIERDIYGGCYVRAQILCRPYQTPILAGVSLRLLSIMKVKDGQKFGLNTDLFDIEEMDADDFDEDENDDDDAEF